MKFNFNSPVLGVDGKPYASKNKKRHVLADELAYLLIRQTGMPDPQRYFDLAKTLKKHQDIEINEQEREVLQKTVSSDSLSPLFLTAQILQVLATPKE